MQDSKNIQILHKQIRIVVNPIKLMLSDGPDKERSHSIVNVLILAIFEKINESILVDQKWTLFSSLIWDGLYAPKNVVIRCDRVNDYGDTQILRLSLYNLKMLWNGC